MAFRLVIFVNLVTKNNSFNRFNRFSDIFFMLSSDLFDFITLTLLMVILEIFE